MDKNICENEDSNNSLMLHSSQYYNNLVTNSKRKLPYKLLQIHYL